MNTTGEGDGDADAEPAGCVGEADGARVGVGDAVGACVGEAVRAGLAVGANVGVGVAGAAEQAANKSVLKTTRTPIKRRIGPIFNGVSIPKLAARCDVLPGVRLDVLSSA